MTTDETIQPDEAPLPSRKVDGRLGCALVFAIGLASMAGAFYIMKRKEATQLDAATELARIVEASDSAEGADAVRSHGCARAAVLPMETLAAVAQRLEDARAPTEKREPKVVDLGTDRTVIVCSAPPKTAPSCRDVAVTFASAVKNAALPFVVVVMNGDAVGCSEEYAGNPDKMSSTETLDLPPIFPATE